MMSKNEHTYILINDLAVRKYSPVVSRKPVIRLLLPNLSSFMA